MDEATINMLNMPRCGVMDNMGLTDKKRKNRGKRYALAGRWDKTDLTWRINSFAAPGYPEDLPRDAVIQIMRDALDVRFLSTIPIKIVVVVFCFIFSLFCFVFCFCFCFCCFVCCCFQFNNENGYYYYMGLFL